MTDIKKAFLEKELVKIEKQLQVVTGVKRRHSLLKRKSEIKSELKKSRRS